MLRKEGAKTMQVNFSRNLAQIIREIKYLDAMGFHLPEFALSVTLQEDKYDLDVESLENMLEVHVQQNSCAFQGLGFINFLPRNLHNYCTAIQYKFVPEFD